MVAIARKHIQRLLLSNERRDEENLVGCYSAPKEEVMIVIANTVHRALATSSNEINAHEPAVIFRALYA